MGVSKMWAAQTGNVNSETNSGRQNQALEQTRDNVLRYGESVGCELLNFFVMPRRPHRSPGKCDQSSSSWLQQLVLAP